MSTKPEQRYKIDTSRKPLGSGGFSDVVVAQDILEKRMVAIKVFKNTKRNAVKYWQNESKIMEALRHAHIVQFYDKYELNGKYNIVMELLHGGELFDRIIDKGRFSERDAVIALRQCLSAISYFHGHMICHRDLKPENIIYVTKKPDSLLKITDFGVAGKATSDTSMTSFVGSKYYVAPEILVELPHYGIAVDCWSMGIITYILLVGYPPYDGNKQSDVYKKILAYEVQYDKRDWSKISQNGLSFVKGFLTKDPALRLTANGAIAHPWIRETAADVDLDVTKKLQDFKAKAQWKAAANAVRAVANIVDVLAADGSEDA